MRDGAKVISIDAIRRFRAGYAEFGEQARLALSNAESDVLRAIGWIEDRGRHWQHELRRRERALTEAKSELFRAEMAARESRASTTLERRAVDRATRAVEEARTKIERCKRWRRDLERDSALFKGRLQPLSGRLDRDVPMGMARLGQMLDRLEAYLRVTAPDAASPAGGEPAAPTATDADAKEDDS